MVTIFTRKNCFMFNMKDYDQEIELLATLTRLRKEDSEKTVNIRVTETDTRKLLYKVKPCNIIEMRMEFRRYNVYIGDQINSLINTIQKEKVSDKEEKKD